MAGKTGACMDVKKISAILGIILAGAAILGAIIQYDKSVVKAEDLKSVQQSIDKMNMRLDRSDLEAMNRDIQRRMWMLEDQHGTNEAKNLYEYKCLMRDFKNNEMRINELNKTQ